MINIFKIKREERWLALGVLVLLLILNGMLVAHYYDAFTPIQEKTYRLFVKGFKVSGFDPLTYHVLTYWGTDYNVYRHPLLAFFMYIPYLLNQGLMYVTGINCALFLATVMQVFCGFYSVIFLYRICREVVELGARTSALLALLFFSFAYVMVSCIVPDHFVLSMMLLLLALYVSGRRMKSGRPLKVWQGALYFLLTAGTSLNNGLKIFFSGLFVNGKRFFRPAYLVGAVLLPAALLWGFARWEYKTFRLPVELANHAAKVKKKAAQKEFYKAHPEKKPAKKKKVARKTGHPFMSGEFMGWSDATTPRVDCIVENFFGEGIQLHQDHLLEDQLRSRPMIVHYRYAWQYGVEGVIVLLFLAGIWLGRRSKFLWLVMSYFLMDALLHIGLGFGITEVYIMSAHWIYAIPIAIAFVLKQLQGRAKTCLTAILGVVTAYLLLYNGALIASYLC